ncbi:Aldehyde/histidinol dehydrogenase [Aspergillus cavernicola]|uniref:Aldehyde/histidinol dehydrogenase n=1 Tax=Aspergillus cavernicola TaxID=176166 RepID=A0ABR4HFW5_9EURO
MAESGSTITVPLIINGRDITSREKFDVISPGTREIVWISSSVTHGLADEASTTKPVLRRAIFLQAADILEQRAPECEEYMAEETGAIQPFMKINVTTAAELLRDLAGRINKAPTGQLPVCQEEGTHEMVLREPYGVVLGIALCEVSPRCFWLIGSIFREAGLPPGCLNVIYHHPEAAAEITTQLIKHPAVRKMNFTGSTAVGRIISSTAGRNLKPVLMELGGKSSAIVCEDADLDLAAQQCAIGAFLHSGQICMSTERILVHHTVLTPFAERLKAAIGSIFGQEGTPQTVAQFAAVVRNHHLVQDVVSKGATVVHGHHSDNDTGAPSSFQLQPTVVQAVTPSMDLYQTESFGPTVSLILIDSDEQAISISNYTDYGLSGAVFTRDLTRGLTLAKQMQTGAVHINSMNVHDEPSLPHGGVKSSGWGRFNADMGLDGFLQTKTTIKFKH